MPVANETFAANVAGKVLIKSVNYRLVQIEEEMTPLHSGVSENYYTHALIGMAIVLLLAILISYIVTCSRYRKRIRELDEQKLVQPTWNLWKLKQLVNELELKKAEIAIDMIC